MTPKEVMAMIKDKGIQAVDMRFIDLPGLWQHFTMSTKEFGEEAFEEGLGFGLTPGRGGQTCLHADRPHHPPLLPEAQRLEQAARLEIGATDGIHRRDAVGHDLEDILSSELAPRDRVLGPLLAKAIQPGRDRAEDFLHHVRRVAGLQPTPAAPLVDKGTVDGRELLPSGRIVFVRPPQQAAGG